MVDNEDLVQENQQGQVSPRTVLSTGVDQSFVPSIPSAPQLAASSLGNGPHVQSSVPSPDTHPSLPIPLACLNPLTDSRGFSSGSAVMPVFHSLSDSIRPTEYPRLAAAMLAPAHPDASLGSALRRRSQTLLPSGSSTTQPNLATHGPNLQTTLDNPGQSASVAQRTSPTSFSVHSLPAHFSSEYLHTPYDSFPGQYMVPAPPSLLQSQPSQPQAYHGYHPLGPSPYPPTQYYPLPPNEPQPYFQHSTSMYARQPSYQQARHRPLPTPQFAPSGLGPSHARPCGSMQQYVPHIYGPGDHFSLVQQYQHETGRWYYGTDSSAGTFVEGDLIRIPRSYPYPPRYPPTERPHKDSMLRIQSTGSQSIPPLTSSLLVDPNGSTASAITSRHTTSAAAGESQEQTSVQSSQETDAYSVSQKSARSQDRPFVRRHYHPNPTPNRSEWVMWVGNVPNDATEEELSQFLRQSSPGSSGSEGSNSNNSGLISVFLISRSNCAFANYQSEGSLNYAISRFNGLKLRPHDRRCPRLVCRVRRKEDDLRAGVGAQRGMGVHTHHVKNMFQKGRKSLTAGGKVTPPKGGSSVPYKTLPPPRNEEAAKSDTGEGGVHKVPTQSPSSYASTSSSLLARHFPRRFFILKSLTRYDLDISIDRGVWATQKHNEAILDQAFRTSGEVFLIFSVNKSGEFYGYARMASGISRGDHPVSWAPRCDASPRVPSPSMDWVPIRGAPEQRESSSSPTEMQTLPSERFETSRSPLPLSPEETEDFPSGVGSSLLGSAQERRPAPFVLELDPSDDTPPPGFSGDCPSDPSDPDPRSALQPNIRLAPRSQGGGMDDPCHRGPLPPVVEEVQTEDGVEGQPTQTAVVPAAIRGYSEGHEPEESWGQTFRIEWLCTQRVQFHRTRHLRNPWNHDREIKVSRDGTELEPSVGQQLIDSWLTLASEHVSGDGRRNPTGFVGKRGTKHVPNPGASAESKGVKQGPSQYTPMPQD